ncbi:MAG: linear amide C-N hydrolase [Bythopirellula sp.]
MRRMRNKCTVAFLCIALTLANALPASACSFFFFRSTNGEIFTGRTQEYPGLMNGIMAIVPRDHDFGKYQTKFGFIGLDHPGKPYDGSQFYDGMNEYGLQVSVLGHGDAKPLPLGEGEIGMLDVCGFLLGNASSTDEAVELLKNTTVGLDVIKSVPHVESGFHYAISDKTKSVVIEYITGDGKPTVYENKFGVMTNDPDYPEHVKLTEDLLVDFEIPETDFLPFDLSTTGRFQKLAALNSTQEDRLVETNELCVMRAWSMINSVDIPMGSLYWRWAEKDMPQMTSYALVGDLANRVLYLRTFDNLDVRKVEIDEIDWDGVAFKHIEIFGTPNYRSIQID